ncbi:MAG TPA: glycosyltransferase family 4 protein [Candidatus Limnocylindria bacterium]|nr:glycosyltransferase family 4 protein [Candidatus Limnocylindria bacterium]
MSRICIISHSHYPYDSRVAREAHALMAAGHEVDVICLKYEDQPFFKRHDGVSVYHLPIGRQRGGALRYFYELASFQIAATLLVGALHLRHRYRVVETTSVPDWLVFAAVVPKLLGARVLVDLHECMPEYGATKYGVPLGHPIVRVLSFLEQASIRFADFATTCTEQMRERFVERGAPAEKIAVVLNSFDEGRFVPARYRRDAREDGGFTLICHGTIEPNYGLDLVVRAVHLLRDRLPGLRLEIRGDGTHRPAVEALTRELGLEDRVNFTGWVTMEELLPHLAAADAGVVAVRRDAFRDVTLCTKMWDLVAMEKPVIISRTSAVEAYVGSDCFLMFESGDEQGLAEGIYALYSDSELRARLVRRATARSEPYRWVHQARRYVEIVERLGAPVRRDSKPAGRAREARPKVRENV